MEHGANPMMPDPGSCYLSVAGTCEFDAAGYCAVLMEGECHIGENTCIVVASTDCFFDTDSCEAQSDAVAVCDAEDIKKCSLATVSEALCVTGIGQPCLVEYSGVCAFVTN